MDALEHRRKPDVEQIRSAILASDPGSDARLAPDGAVVDLPDSDAVEQHGPEGVRLVNRWMAN